MATSSATGKFCILGAGSSGLVVAKNFLERGIAFECLEREDEVGGNWCFGKPHSSVYRATRLISSKRETEYTDHPMPADWPEQPGHELVWQYLRDYAEHFGLYRHIEFNTEVKCIEPAGDARSREQGAGSQEQVGDRLPAPSSVPPASRGWDVTLADGTRRRYRGVVIANGHNWDPRWPAYRGSFTGVALHSAQYKAPELYAGRRVLVVGGGNSGFDIAVDVAPHAAETFHSLRRGYHVLPRYYRGTPIDQCGQWLKRWRLPMWIRRLAAARAQRIAWADASAANTPRPDHRLFETHPVINSRWPYDVARGSICVKPDVQSLDGDHILFGDDTRETIDVIIYATGFKLSFPFIAAEHLNWQGERPELYLNIFHPHRDDLFVAGLIQPDSGQFGLVDYQAQLIAGYIRALDHKQPSARRFQVEKRGCGPPVNGGVRYKRSPRHLVEVEHVAYRRELQRWLRRLPPK